MILDLTPVALYLSFLNPFLITASGDNKSQFMFGDHSELDPPDPIPNSEVKRFSVDGSVGAPHVRVEHRQAFNTEKPSSALHLGVFSL